LRRGVKQGLAQLAGELAIVHSSQLAAAAWARRDTGDGSSVVKGLGWIVGTGVGWIDGAVTARSRGTEPTID
jgi:hypothetical protein